MKSFLVLEPSPMYAALDTIPNGKSEKRDQARRVARKQARAMKVKSTARSPKETAQ